MKKTLTNHDNLFEFPQYIVKMAASAIPENEESGLRTVLKAADEFKAAKLTPIFILDQYNMDILVVCKETFGKRLH